MTFYIASKLENAEMVKKVAAVLVAAGHTHTYDWTTHGSVKEETDGQLAQVAEAELSGVLNADMLIVLLPGGRGTHVELGMALGAGYKEIILCAETDEFFQHDDKTCAFYWNNGINRVVGALEVWFAEILSRGRRLDEQAPASG